MQNPFYYGGAVYNEYFCNRITEINTLKTDILSGLNILIYAPRRFGKTSLVLKVIQELKTHNVKYIFLDLMSISTLEEFINAYFNALCKSLEKPTDKIIKFFKNTLKLRPNINVTFDSNGNPSFSLALNGESNIQTLEEVLNGVLEFSKEKQRIAVIFDEFQEITHLNIEAKMRSIIQHHANKISYIFMGSKKSLLHKMFLDKNRPFYKSVKHFVIQEISKDSWSEFISNGFIKSGKIIAPIYIDKIFALTNGFPYYTQQFAYELWNQCKKEVNESVYQQTLNTIMEKENDFFVLEWDNLTLNQRKALKIIVTKDGKNLYDENYLAKYQLKIGSLQSAIKVLLNKDIIDKAHNRYYLIDPLFQFWISEMDNKWRVKSLTTLAL